MDKRLVLIGVLLAAMIAIAVSAQTYSQGTVSNVYGLCGDIPPTANGSWYNESTQQWEDVQTYTQLFELTVDGDTFTAYCLQPNVTLTSTDAPFNVTICPAEPDERNNSIAWILTHYVSDCNNVSKVQSAIWYYWYLINYSKVGEFDNTTSPPDESYWIPLDQEAKELVNESAYKTVPYNLSVTYTPPDCVYPKGDVVVTAYDCLGNPVEGVNITLELDNLNCSYSPNYNITDQNGNATFTITCPAGESTNFTAKMKRIWFEVLYNDTKQDTLRVIEEEVTDTGSISICQIEENPCVKITKYINDSKRVTASPGDMLEIKLIVENCGNVNLTNLSVWDQFPIKKENAGLTYADNANPPEDKMLSSINEEGWIDFDVIWEGYVDDRQGSLSQFEPLEPGESFTITFYAKVDQYASGCYDNCASVTANSTAGSVSDEDCATVCVPTERVPTLTPIGIVLLTALIGAIAALNLRKR